MLYNDYNCKKITDDLFIVYEFEELKEEAIGEFNSKGEIIIYEKFKGFSLGTLIKSFMNDFDIKSNQQRIND
jgi:hypothetical protein